MPLAHTHRPPACGATRLTRTCRGREGGFVMAMTGLLLVPLLLLVGFAVDIGYWYNRAAELQRAADAAALAGVVWLPDEQRAREVAVETAARNGFVHGRDGITVRTELSARSGRRLKVTIDDARVGSFFYEALGGDRIGIARSAFAEHVTPVPLGSPRNYFGTGRLLSSDPELLYQSVNAYCTSKVQGDRHQSAHMTDPTEAVTVQDCAASRSNEEYRDAGYEVYIDVQHPQAVEVRLYDPRFNPTGVLRTNANTACAWTYPAAWSGPSSSAAAVSITGPAVVQTRVAADEPWTTQLNVGSGAIYRRAGNLFRYRLATNTATCEGGIDSNLRSTATLDEQFTYSIAAPDGTPLDDTDNPDIAACRRTFSSTTAFDNYSYLGTRRWNTLCTIPLNGFDGATPTGKYLLRVHNSGVPTGSDGSNQWGLVAYPVGSSGDGLCDGRVTATCPRVYGKDAISVYANTSAGQASFFLAEIGPEHSGKRLNLELWDPGEGGSSIEILEPRGADGWGPHRFDWAAPGSGYGPGNNVTSVAVTDTRFNGRLLSISVDLTGYNPPVNNRWWKIRYTFNDPNTPSVTDRTTWSARIVGDPVHLIEEN